MKYYVTNLMTMMISKAFIINRILPVKDVIITVQII